MDTTETPMTQKARKWTTLVCAAALATGFAGSAMAQSVGATAAVGATANVGVTASTGTATSGVTGLVSGLLGDVTGLLGGLGLGGIL
jgi:hypothetical protein